MALNWKYLQVLAGYGLFKRGNALLDIGTSNIYAAGEEDILAFFRKHGCPDTREFSDYAALVASGSGKAPDGSALNKSWLGQTVEAIGMDYDSIDIAIGYKTRIVDLNRQSLPADMVGRFDTVLNCGTTEHILNQFNAFKCIHEAAKVDGMMVHQLPTTGHTDHGYYTYTSRFFFDLAGYNHYDIIDFWIDGPDGHDKMYAGAKSYVNVFPALSRLLDRVGSGAHETLVDKMDVPNNSITIVLRKRDAGPFMGMVETSTSFGPAGWHDVGHDVLDHYSQ